MQAKTLEQWVDYGWNMKDWPGGHPTTVQRRQHARYGAAMHRWLDRFIDSWLADDD